MDGPEVQQATQEIEDPERRRFLAKFGVACGSIAGLIVAIPAVSFLLGLRKEPRAWRVLGEVDKFTVGQTQLVSFSDPSSLPWAGVTAKTAAWLRREEGQKFIAFSINCTHLGCPVRWLPEAELFMCPCHGGVYYSNGTVASGPPPELLPRYPVRVRQGNVEILTTPLPISGR